jgi:hypothetical protein
MSTSTTVLPLRDGPRPQTTTQIPHTQIDQQPDDDRLLAGLLAEAATWPSVGRAESRISVEGASALVLDHVVDGPPVAFLVGSEFAHGHASGDSSLHVALPVPLASAAELAGWAEPHFLVHQGALPPNIVMLYAPRDEEEARVLLALVRSSYEHAMANTSTTPSPSTTSIRSAS